MPDASEQAAVLALVAAAPLAWHWAGALIEEAGGARRLLAGDLRSLAWHHRADAEALARAAGPEQISRCAELAAGLAARGTSLVTVLDDGYPADLHAAYDRPPFLFVRGVPPAPGGRVVAIAGAADAAPQDVERASGLADALGRRGVTVVAAPRTASGRAALAAAVEAGGPAVAVLDAGIDHPERLPEGLEPALDGRCAMVSPCWPDAAPEPASELHAAVLSGLAMATVVVDGGEDSPVPLQARRCLDQGRRLLLLSPLVLRRSWAKQYAAHPGVLVVDGVEAVLAAVAAIARQRAGTVGDAAALTARRR